MEGDLFRKAEVFVEALPYIRRYQGKYFVIKVGGSTFRIPDAKEDILTDVAFLHLVGIRCILVTGGGPFINDELEKRGKAARFVDGLRVTDGETLSVLEGILSRLRDDVVSHLQGVLSVKASAVRPEEKLVLARKIHYQNGQEVIDLGFVGQVEEVNVDLLRSRAETGQVLVAASLAYGRDGALYNINADSVAASVAEALKAEKLVYMTDVPGIMRNPANPETLISALQTEQAESLMKQGVIKGGMIPKVKSAVSSIQKGVGKVHIISGTTAHSLLLEILTDQGSGTEILKDGSQA